MESKKLRKSSNNRVLCGVCAGIAEYLGIDPVIIRLLFAVLACIGFLGFYMYLVAILIMPEKDEKPLYEQGIEEFKKLKEEVEQRKANKDKDIESFSNDNEDEVTDTDIDGSNNDE